MQTETEMSNDEQIIETAKKRWDMFDTAEGKTRDQSLDDLKFGAGDQWEEQLKYEREQDGRPCLVINRWPQFISQIVNDQRQNRPSPRIHPVDDRGDVETAKIYQGLIRHIEHNSDADVAYDQAFEGAVRKGFGYWHLTTDYVNPYSFEQEIKINPILNDFSVKLDPFHEKPDGSDANWGLIAFDLSKEEYIAEYGESKLAEEDDWTTLGSSTAGWVGENSCRVVEYYTKEHKEENLVLLKTGETLLEKRFYELYPELSDSEREQIIVDRRKTNIPKIMWYKLNGVEVLEKTEIPGEYIPIIPVYGRVLNIDGEIIRESACRHAKDSQKMSNYWASAEAETIALAPRAPFIAAEGQIPEEYAYQWKTANRKNHAVLTYAPTDHKGNLLPPPQRNAFEPPVQAITNARLQANEDLKATTGIYDSALGNRSNETSGVAIQRRNVQAQTSNFHFIDNLTRSIRHSTRIIIQWIPVIYDTARAARIIGEEGEQEIVRINEEFEYKGKNVNFNLSRGKYDVVVETGPSFATKRQEAADTMLRFIQAYPQAAGLIGDLIAKNMDWPGAQEISERFKKTLPEGLVDEPGELEIPPQVRAKMNQLNKLVEILQAQLVEAQRKLETDELELQSKERIESAKLQKDYAKLENEILLEKMKQASQFANREVDRQQKELDIIQKNIDLENRNRFAPNNMPTSGPSLGTPPKGEF